MTTVRITKEFIRKGVENNLSEEEKTQARKTLMELGIDISEADKSLTGSGTSGFKFEGKVYSENYHRDVLVKLCELVLARHRTETDKILTIKGRTRKYFSKHSKELSHDYRRVPGTEIYVELNQNAATLSKVCHQVLIVYEIPLSSFEILL